MHGSKNQSPTRTPKCWWRGKPENKVEKPLQSITTPNNPLMRIVAIHTAYKPSKLSSNYVLEPPTPTSNRFLKSFLLTSLCIRNWASNCNLHFSLATLRLFQWFPSSNQQQTLKVVMGVMVLISCLKFDNLRGVKVEWLLRVKDLGFFFFLGTL